MRSHFSTVGKEEIMNRQVVFALAAAILLAAIASAGDYSGGDGSAEYPYRIATPNDLNDIGNHVEDFNKCFVMVNDVNLADYTGTHFNIIGDWGEPFSGVFDGNDHTVSNFSYDTFGGSGPELDGIGIFKHVKGEAGKPVEIKNLELIDPNVISENGDYIGSLIGMVGQGPAQIDNCYANRVKVSGNEKIGGLIGALNYHSSAVVSNCSSTGEVKGNKFVGGLMGFHYLGTISKCWANCNVEGVDLVGGLVGYDLEGDINESWSSGTVKGDRWIGGLVGKSPEFYTIPTIKNCYSSCNVDANTYVGGLIGNSEINIKNCFSSGKVLGTVSVGGLIGDGFPNRTSNSFWDTETSWQTLSDGGEGKTTAEMKTESTFTDASWDFIEIWNIGENQAYPYLRVYPAGDLNHDGRIDFFDFAIAASHWLEGTEP
jgi:hypothetical protein